MPRVKRGVQKNKRRKNLLSQVKGYRHGRKSKKSLARTAFLRAGATAFRDRRAKKRTFRGLWNIKINAGARANGTTYSKLINGLKKANIDLDRKVLAGLAEKFPNIFKKVVDSAK